MNNLTAKIFDIQRTSFVDGPGIRTTVFLKGCNLRCAWCHNPESQNPHCEMMIYKNKCVKCGKCKEKCSKALKKCNLCGECVAHCLYGAREICGKEVTIEEVIPEILKDKALYQNSNGGVTFSGGECMLQIDFLEAILKRCKEEGMHTAVDTAGHVSFDKFERILPYTDLFLYDLKICDNEKHKRFVGVSNEVIISNLKKLISLKKRIWVRVPIIQGINDTTDEILAIADICSGAEKIELLPYHAMGEHKYAALGRALEKFMAPDNTVLEKLNALVKNKV